MEAQKAEGATTPSESEGEYESPDYKGRLHIYDAQSNVHGGFDWDSC